MRRVFIVLFACFLLAACAPQATLVQGETQFYMALSGDAIVETPRPIAYAEVRVQADSVSSPNLVSTVPSEFGFYRLTFPEDEYGACLRIKAENATSGWVGVTMVGADVSEYAVLETVPRPAPAGC